MCDQLPISVTPLKGPALNYSAICKVQKKVLHLQMSR